MRCSVFMALVGMCFLTACKVPLEVTPENVTVDCKEQDLTFHSNVGYSFMEISTYCTDYPEFTKSVENGYITLQGDWFKIEGQRYTKDIKVHLSENKGISRNLTFWVRRQEFSQFVTVNQSGIE